VVPVQVLVQVSARRRSETQRGEAEAGEAAAGTRHHLLLLVQGVSAAGAERGRAAGVAGRGAVTVVVGGGRGRRAVGGAPSRGPTHHHVVVIQVREGGQARGPVGDGRAPAVGGLEGGGGVDRRGGEFGVRRRGAVLRVRGAAAVHGLFLPPHLLLLLLLQQVQRQGLEGQRETGIGPAPLPGVLLFSRQSLFSARSARLVVRGVQLGRGLLGQDGVRRRREVRKRRARQRATAPVPPRQAAAAGGVVAVRRRGQGEGEGEDGLAGSVEELDLAPVEVLPLREGVDPSGDRHGNGGRRVQRVEHVGFAAGEARIRRVAEGAPAQKAERWRLGFKKKKKE